MRVVIFSKLLDSITLGSAAITASQPAALRRLPYGWGWLSNVLPFDARTVGALELACWIACLLALLGVFTRVAAPLAALLAVYVLGLPNFYLKIDHSLHGSMLCALILAVSPCADALSLDALRWRMRGGAPPPDGVQYTVPVRCCWLVLSTVYLFPGIWKLWDAGDLWISGVQLKSELYAKWAELQTFQPLFRVDEHPWLLSLVGVATLVFEIGFFFALFNRYTRVLAAFSATAFHWGIWQTMGIRFHITLPLVLLFDFPGLPNLLRARLPGLMARADTLHARATSFVRRLAERLRFAPPTLAFPVRHATLALVVGLGLFSAQTAAGFAQVDSWPIAVHPRFSNRKPKPKTTATRMRVMFQPAAGGGEQDLMQSLVRLGSARLLRLAKRLQDVRGERALASEGAMLVSLFRDTGVTVAAGDRIELREEKWDLLPLGEHRNLRHRTSGRFEVTPGGALIAVPRSRSEWRR